MALIFGNKLTVEQRLEAATSKIMGHSGGKYDALPGLLMHGSCTVDEGTPTACTDGLNEWYGRKFCDGLNDPELRFLRMHEVLHKMRMDLFVWKHLFKEDAKLAGQACDYVNNLTLVELDAGEGFIKMPTCGLLDPSYHGMDAGQVFNLLKKKKEDKEQQGDKPAQGGSGGEPQLGEIGGGFDEHDHEAAQAMSEEAAKELAQDIDNAIRQGAVYAGRKGSGGKRLVEDLLASQVRWEDALRDFLQQQVAGRDYSSWRKVHRRSIASGEYLPSGVSEVMQEIVIGIDTSGSIGGAFIAQFLGEVKGIVDSLQPELVRLMYWDTEVCKEEVYLSEDFDKIIRTTKPEGGGGTDPRCVTQYMEKKGIKPECVVMLTDGYVGSWGGEWSVPVLWCVLNNKSASPTTGQVVHIKI